MVTEIHSFLRLAWKDIKYDIDSNKRFIEGFLLIATPLTRLTMKDIKYEWPK
jgi:hypothetical protein